MLDSIGLDAGCTVAQGFLQVEPLSATVSLNVKIQSALLRYASTVGVSRVVIVQKIYPRLLESEDRQLPYFVIQLYQAGMNFILSYSTP